MTKFVAAFKNRLKTVLQNNGWYLRKSNGLSYGVDLFTDISRLGVTNMNYIFDVGAHKGETAVTLSMLYPESAIYAFEPVIENYAVLESSTQKCKNVSCLNLAVGETCESQIIELRSDSQTHSLKHVLSAGDANLLGYKSVEVTTVDSMMLEKLIERISLLKIDTEGYELSVLKGAKDALSEGKIDFIYLEASVLPSDSAHSSLFEIRDFLDKFGYSLTAIYEQVVWKSPIRLAYFNALFSRDTISKPGGT